MEKNKAINIIDYSLILLITINLLPGFALHFLLLIFALWPVSFQNIPNLIRLYSSRPPAVDGLT